MAPGPGPAEPPPGLSPGHNGDLQVALHRKAGQLACGSLPWTVCDEEPWRVSAPGAQLLVGNIHPVTGWLAAVGQWALIYLSGEAVREEGAGGGLGL